MAIPLTELIENPSKLDELEQAQLCCAYCGVPLQETVTGNRKTPRGRACSDCYYEQLGVAIEEHPIVSGKVRRG
jgi:hypothetical protein